MNQQGGKPPGHEDDWWGQLYDDSADDTGATAAADSLEDRFASAAGTVDEGARVAPGSADEGMRPVPGAVDEGASPVSRTAGEGARPVPGIGGEGARSAPGPLDGGPRPVAGSGVPAPRAGVGGSLLGGTADADASGHRPAAATGDDSSPSPAGRGVGTAPPLGASPFPPPPPPPLISPAPPVPQPFRGEAPLAAPAYPPSPAALTGPPPNLPALSPPPPQPPSPPPASLTLDYVGSGPPTYDAEPTALPPADPDDLDDLVADTVLDGARYGSSTLRAASVRGDSARFRGEPRRDSLLTARFGVGEQALVLVAMATGARATPGAHRAAAEACHWIGRAVGRSHARLAEDIRAARRGDLKSGLHRLTDRSLGKLRASAAEQGIDPDEYAATLRCLLLPAHPECRTRVFFGVGPGGLFRLRDGEWQDIEPTAGDTAGEAVVGFGSQPAETPEGDRLTMDLGIPTPPSPYEPAPEPPREPFRFRASVARPGDTLLMCTGGLAEPLRGEPELSAHLAGRWSAAAPPGLAAFLADTQVRVKGYADDRTAAAVWEA
ncbi:protein phosphatase 2C domain-containing protein [Streptomyces sp. STR69]|uniref:protein phosphatase 2C domain-containing protein n=1 Tax=Streptomyces sp. STR69 TaxID=1796942 RepID=UPI0021C9C246|nr:protein phosphatase 2C domain-containing protein [Streptomyces sp. STR69]